MSLASAESFSRAERERASGALEKLVRGVSPTYVAHVS